jgi:hypothetical protein
VQALIIPILKAAAIRALAATHQLGTGFVTIDDLISEAWLRNFLYMRTLQYARKYLFLHAMRTGLKHLSRIQRQSQIQRNMCAATQKSLNNKEFEYEDVVVQSDVVGSNGRSDGLPRAKFAAAWRVRREL